MQRGIVSIAAVALLALPVSLGFIVANAGSHMQSPAALSQRVMMQNTLVGGNIVGKVVSSLAQSTIPAANGGQSVAHTDAYQPKTDLLSRLPGGDDDRGKGPGHKHKHKHGDD